MSTISIPSTARLDTRKLMVALAAFAIAAAMVLAATLAFRAATHSSSSRLAPQPTPYVGTVNSTADNPSWGATAYVGTANSRADNPSSGETPYVGTVNSGPDNPFLGAR